jgi:hypothetical protein
VVREVVGGRQVMESRSECCKMGPSRALRGYPTDKRQEVNGCHTSSAFPGHRGTMVTTCWRGMRRSGSQEEGAGA